MKILHVNTHANGGAFNGAYRLHVALLKQGIHSKMIVKSDDINKKYKEVYCYNKRERKTTLFNRITSRFGFPITAEQKRWKLFKNSSGDLGVVSMPITDYDITKSKEYKECDIVHLHWIGDYLDYNSFFAKCTKPVVITLRDSYTFQGVFHLYNDKIRNAELIGAIDSKMASLKAKAISKSKVPKQVVGLSTWMTKQSSQSEVHKGISHTTIHNCLNSDEYEVLDRNQIREEFNIPTKHHVFSFVSDGVHNILKGIDILLGAINLLSDMSNITILTVGRGISPQLPFNVVHRHLGNLSQKQLVKVYNVSDAFIFPTKEEALGNVMLEAMACGTPVIGTPVGGLLDVIKPGLNGLFSKDVTADGLKAAIEEFIKIKDTFSPQKIRSYIQENFSEELIAEKYIKLYNEILDK